MAMVMTFLALSLQGVGAEKVQWKDPDYNFEAIKTVRMEEIVMQEPAYENFITDTAAAEKVEIALKKALQERNIKVEKAQDEETTQSADESVKPLLLKEKKPLVTVQVYALGRQWVWKEAWTEKRMSDKKISVLNDQGGYTTISIPYPETIEHPRRKFWTARAELELSVRDPKTNKVVYTIHDMRVLEGTDDTTGMLKRITKDFAKDISRNS